MFLPPIRISFPLLPGFSFGPNPTSYPVHNDSHISHRVLTFKKYEKKVNASDHTTINSNLIVLFRVLAFYIDLQALPGFWENIARGWDVTDVENTRSIVNFYADRHVDWANSPRASTRNMFWRDRLLVHLVGYWCEHRGKAIRQSGPNDLRLFRDMDFEWTYLRDIHRGALFSEEEDASLRGIAQNVPELTIPHSFFTRRDKTPARRLGQSQEFNGTRESRTDPRAGPKSSQSVKGGYTEQRDPRQFSRGSGVPGGAQPLDTSFNQPQKSRLPSGVVNEPVASQQSKINRMMTGGHQQRHEEYIASQPFQINPSHLGVSQSLDSSCPQSQVLPVITKSVTPAKNTKSITPKPSAKKPQPKKQVPLSPKRAQKAPTPSPSPSTGSDGDADSEESESGSESETESSSIYQDTGSGAEPGVIQRFKLDHIPRRVTRSLTSSPSGNSSDSGDSSDSGSDSDMNDKVDGNSHQRVSDNVGESSSSSGSGSDSGSESYSSSGDSNDGVSDNKGRSSRNTNEGSSVNDSDGSSDGSDDDNDGSDDNDDSDDDSDGSDDDSDGSDDDSDGSDDDSDGSDDDSDGSEDESDSEPEPPKPLTPKNSGTKKPAKTTVEASTRGEKKAWSSDDMSEEEEEIKSEPDSDSSVPMASIPTKDQEPPTSAQRASAPPTKRDEKPKPEVRSAKRRREEDEVEKPTAGGRPAAKRRATTQQQSSPSEKTKSSEARRRDRKNPTEAPCGEESSKSRRFAENESSPLLEQMFKDLPQIESEHKRSIDMLIRRLNALEEKNMRQDKKIAKQDKKIMKQNKKFIRQDKKIIKQNKKIIRQDEKMMK